MAAGAVFAVSAAAYFGIAARSAAAQWRQALIADQGSRAPPLRRLLAAVFTLIARQDSDSPALELLPPHVQSVIKAHEAAHRAGAGEFEAYLAQTTAHLGYLAGEAAPLARRIWNRVPERSRRATEALLKTFYEMSVGDAALAHIIQPLSSQVSVAKRLLVADATLNGAMAFLLGPLLASASAAAAVGLVAGWPMLALYSALLTAACWAYVYVERTHTVIDQVLSLWGVAAYRAALTSSLLDRNMDFHGEQTAGKLGGRLLVDTNYLFTKNVQVRLILLHYSLYLAFGLGMTFFLSWPLALLTLAIVPALGIVAGIYTDRLAKMGEQVTEKKSDLNEEGLASLDQVETVKVFGTKDWEQKRYDRGADELWRLNEDYARVQSVYSTLTGSLSDFFTRFGVYIAGGLLVAGSLAGLSLATVVQFAGFANFIFYAFLGLTHYYTIYKTAEAQTAATREMLLHERSKDSPQARPLPEGPLSVRFEDVSFSYPGREAPALQSVSLQANAGETIGIVGETGSGKSTLVNLLLGLWKPDGGKILVGSQDILDTQRQSLLGGVGIVTSDTRLFPGTIRENMLFGNKEVSEEKLQQVIKMAGARFFETDKKRFPEGLDTDAQEGKRLSGGERQRIAIIRALLRDPRVLVLDEATRSLDQASEAGIQRALDALPAGQTRIVIAHRLSTVRHADRIYVLKAGRVIESGTHQELLALDGVYAKLVGKEARRASRAANRREAHAKKATNAEQQAAANPESSPQAEAPLHGMARARAWLKRVKLSMGETRASAINLIRGDRQVEPFVPLLTVLGLGGLLTAVTGLQMASARWIELFLKTVELTAKTSWHAHSAELLGLSAAITAATALGALLSWQTQRRQPAFSARVAAQIRKTLMGLFHDRPLSFHHEHSSGGLGARLNDDTETLASKNVDQRVSLVPQIVMLGFSVYFMLHANAAIVALVLALIPLLGLANGYFGSKVEKSSSTYSKARQDVGKLGNLLLDQVRVIKLFGAERQEAGRYAQKAFALAAVGQERARYIATNWALTSSVSDFFTKYLIFIVGAWEMVFHPLLTVGAVTAMTIYTGYIKGSLSGLSQTWLSYKQARGETEFIRKVLAEGKATSDRPGARPLPSGPARIQFEDVDFHHGHGGPGVENINLTIEPGQTVAFVGPSGSGKSTLLALLHRLVAPQSGKVLINGMDIADATADSLSRDVAKVSQETWLFNETLRYNLTYGSTNVSDEQLRQAIKAAGAEFVFDEEKFPEGLETRVTGRGQSLSDGQRQRVALVRALLRRAPVLILDEATAALDKDTERRVVTALREVKTSDGYTPTKLVVAHNLTTTEDADQIVVLEDGQIVAVGTQEQLLETCPLYQELWEESLDESD
ncbi:MAG: ABC transporter ATP-binding protein [Elusimicrobia bacterium]|nr:ABC transporter ATP-binding protein [Elusimicrobiota bacterium]